jgi:hypothetical protein
MNDMPKKKRSASQNRRYRLHQKIKMRFEYYAKQKLVVIPHDCDLKDPFVIELRDRYRYSIQYSILSPKEIEVKEETIIT